MKENKNNKHKDMRSYIMGKAFHLMAKKGIKDISMREISSACGVTKPVLYYYFKDKDDLCFQLIEASMQRYNEGLKELISSNASFASLLEHMFNTFLTDFAKRDGAAEFALHFHSYVRSNPVVKKKLIELKRENDMCVEELLRKELERSNLSSKELKMLEHLVSAVMAHMVLNVKDDRHTFDKAFSQDITQCILKAVSYKEKEDVVK